MHNKVHMHLSLIWLALLQGIVEFQLLQPVFYSSIHIHIMCTYVRIHDSRQMLAVLILWGEPEVQQINNTIMWTV